MPENPVGFKRGTLGRGSCELLPRSLTRTTLAGRHQFVLHMDIRRPFDLLFHRHE
jgi:hypothetical protein